MDCIKSIFNNYFHFLFNWRVISFLYTNQYNLKKKTKILNSRTKIKSNQIQDVFHKKNCDYLIIIYGETKVAFLPVISLHVMEKLRGKIY